MNAEFEKFVLERQSTEHELMYGLKPEDWEWQLAVVATPPVPLRCVRSVRRWLTAWQ